MKRIASLLTPIVLLHAAARLGQAMIVTDLNNDRILVEWSDHVFVGKVIKQAGTAERHGIPTTQFEVEVVLNIKGTLLGTTVVSQEGGYQNGQLMLVRGGDVVGPAREGSDPLVEPGSTYLFTSRFSTDQNLHFLLSHPNAKKRISEDASLSRAQLEALARQDEKVLKLQEAHRRNLAFYAKEKSPVTEALDHWFASNFLLQVNGEPELDTRGLDPILDRFSDQVALVIAKRIEEGDPRLLSEGRIRFGSGVALRRLGHRAAPAVPILVRSLRQIRNSAPVDWLRFNGAMEMLREVSTGASALEDLLSLIRGPDSYSVFHFSVEPLVTIVRGSGRDVLPRLDSFLAHSDLHTRLTAAVTISRCFEPSEGAVRVIRECFEKAEPEALNFVLQDLKRMKGDKSMYLPQLVALLKHPQPTIAGTAVAAIGGMGKPALPTILKLLTDDELAIRSHGSRALLNYVRETKTDPDTWQTVVSVISGIAKDNPRQALGILNEFTNELRVSPEIGFLLRELEKSPDRAVNSQATRLLRQMLIPPAPLR